MGTGAAMNPAQVIGPASVFFCGTDVMGIYIAAQLFAAVLACGVYVFVSGFGPLSPFISSPALELSKSEAMICGSQALHPSVCRRLAVRTLLTSLSSTNSIMRGSILNRRLRQRMA